MIQDTIKELASKVRETQLSELTSNPYDKLQSLVEPMRNQLEEAWGRPLTESITDHLVFELECNLLWGGGFLNQLQAVRPLVDRDIRQHLYPILLVRTLSQPQSWSPKNKKNEN